ncbi:MAG TPA: metallophosphoesterase family protein [Sphaerochaeta sp.]|nr:metallophosphoesterase family protein [Sphaerochaeta sp.]
MKLAVLSDVHGNLRALEAVLSDAKALGVDHILFLGDLVFMGLDPQPCFDLLMATKPLVTIKGNTDSNIEGIKDTNPTSEEEKISRKFIRYTDIRLKPESKAVMKEWSIVQRGEIGNDPFIFCHGSPYSYNEAITEDIAPTSELYTKLMAEDASVILCGHTHIPADFMLGEKRIINPGAVGYSFDGDTRASYAFLDIHSNKINATIRRIEYDREIYMSEVRHASHSFKFFSSVLYTLEHGEPDPKFKLPQLS